MTELYKLKIDWHYHLSFMCPNSDFIEN